MRSKSAPLTADFKEALFHGCGLETKEPFLIGVSGGSDSVALLHLLQALPQKSIGPSVVLHFNHQLRGCESDLDESFVASLAREFGLITISGRGDVKGFAKKNRVSLEMGARELRHRFFAEVARRLNVSQILLAHHLDDQLELFFLRLLRGAGDGLVGMQPHSVSPFSPRLRILRPMLGISKERILEFLKIHRIPFREDLSNSDSRHHRNWIRNVLFPSIGEKYPGFKKALAKSINLLRSQQEDVAAIFDQLAGSGFRDIQSLPKSFLRMAVQKELRSKGVSVTFDLVEGLCNNVGKRISVGRGDFARRDPHGTIVLEKENAGQGKFNPTKSRVVRLIGKGFETRFGGGSLSLEVSSDGSFPDFATKPVGTDFLDAEKVGPVIILRHWREGDRFHPLGSAGSMKVQDFLVNLKIPRAERHQLVVATNEKDEIFWIEKGRISERFKLDKGSRQRLKWIWQRT
jgi:tRNA(Ile)-lysidine synthase